MQHQASSIFHWHGLRLSYTLLMSLLLRAWHLTSPGVKNRPNQAQQVAIFAISWMVWGMVNYLGHFKFWKALVGLFGRKSGIKMSYKQWLNVWQQKMPSTFKVNFYTVKKHGSLLPPINRAFSLQGGFERILELLRLRPYASAALRPVAAAFRRNVSRVRWMQVPLWHQRWHHADAQKKARLPHGAEFFQGLLSGKKWVEYTIQWKSCENPNSR